MTSREIKKEKEEEEDIMNVLSAQYNSESSTILDTNHADDVIKYVPIAPKYEPNWQFLSLQFFLDDWKIFN